MTLVPYIFQSPSADVVINAVRDKADALWGEHFRIRQQRVSCG